MAASVTPRRRHGRSKPRTPPAPDLAAAVDEVLARLAADPTLSPRSRALATDLLHGDGPPRPGRKPR